MTVNIIRNYVNKFSMTVDSVDALINSRKLGTLGEVYIQSYYGGWEATTDGPKGGHLVHTTGGTASAPTVPPAVSVGTIGTGAQAGYYWDLDGIEWEVSYNDGVTPEQFGANWDEITDSSLAFANLSEYIERLGGGRINLSPITYIVGEQTIDSGAGTPYYTAPTMLDIRNCTKPVVIAGNGAVMKIKDGQAYGGFDPVTGLSSGDVSGNALYAAGLGFIVNLRDNASVSLSDLEIDGNITNINLGGTWGPAGRQIVAYGFELRNNRHAHLKNIYTHHHCLDGSLIQLPGSTELDEAKPVLLENVKSEYNARQGLSLTGSIGLTAINCDFSFTGQAVFNTSPGAGLDIEAESAVNRNATFINCRMIDNNGVAMVADSGDSADMTFRDCLFVGAYDWAIWPRKPRFRFENCKIVGPAVNIYQDAIEENGTKFFQCLFTDDVNQSPSGNVFASAYVVNGDQTASTVGSVYDRCTFYGTTRKVGFFRNGPLVKDSVFNQIAGQGVLINRDFVLFFSACTIDNNTINDQITLPEADPYYIALDSTVTRQRFNLLTSPSNNLYWNSWSAGAGGYAGLLGIIDSASARNVRVNRRDRNDQFYGSQKILFDNAIPTSNDYLRGDIVINDQATAGGKVGWVCVTAGSPGTWKAFGVIDV